MIISVRYQLFYLLKILSRARFLHLLMLKEDGFNNSGYYTFICDWILETNQNVTLGQLHFLGPANSHTHTLSMRCYNTKLSCLVYFSRADFADHVKPRLRQWDPWRALEERYVSDIHPCVSKTLIRPSRLVKAYD